MSVVGFDVGNDTSCIALARKRGIDVIMNKESKRETPAVVSFGDKMRFLGTDGATKLSTSPKSTIHQLKRLLGKKFNDPSVQADMQKFPFAVKPAPDGGVLVQVSYCQEVTLFTPEQLMAMVLVDLKNLAEADQGTPVVDCCISVPTYYTEAERYAMLNASQIAGLNCLRLINETTATALAYGIYKTDLPETDAVNVAFVDVGHSSTQVSIVAFKKGGLLVKAHTWERNLGGRDFDEVLFDHLCEEFKAKYKLDIKSNAKVSFKLRVACEKLKKMLSANSEAPLNIECLMDDVDVKALVTREQFEALAQPVLNRLKDPLERAIRDSGLSLEDISSVEVIGSSTRVPALFKIISDVFGKTPSRTMHSKECVSRGCALQCAMLSPVFKVRDFEVIDSFPYSIAVEWEKDGSPIKQVLFERGNAVPSTKMLSFFRNQPFTMRAFYADDANIPESFDKNIAAVTVGPFTVPAGSENAKLKVKIKLNLHGLLVIESVQSIEEEEYEEVVKPAATPAPAPAVPEPATDDTPMTDAAAGAVPDANGAPATEPMADGPEAEAPKVVKKKRTKKVNVPYKSELGGGYTKKQLDDFFEKEVAMQGADRLQEETNERKNALEAYVYDLRGKLYDQYSSYVKDADKEMLSKVLSDMEDWLYDEGEDTTKSVYTNKLEELKKLGNPIDARYFEDHNRSKAIQQLENTIQDYSNLLTSRPPQYAHIPDEDWSTIVKELESAGSWLAEKRALQGNLQKWDDPVLLCGDITKKREVIDRVAKPIFAKPAPPPPKPAEEPKAEPMESEVTEDKSQPAPMDSPAPQAATSEPMEEEPQS